MAWRGAARGNQVSPGLDDNWIDISHPYQPVPSAKGSVALSNPKSSLTGSTTILLTAGPDDGGVSDTVSEEPVADYGELDDEEEEADEAAEEEDRTFTVDIGVQADMDKAVRHRRKKIVDPQKELEKDIGKTFNQKHAWTPFLWERKRYR